jgi:sugar-specific transcriptional regulator TrmB
MTLEIRQEIRRHLRDLGFNQNEVAVYIALTQLGESSSAKVAKKAELPRTTAASVLDRLAGDGYVSSHLYHGTTWYWIESPKMLENVFENRIEIARKLGGLLADSYRSEADFPNAKVYDTKAGIKSFIEKTLVGLKPGTIISTIDTPGAGNYTRIYSDGFGDILLKIKKKKRITTRTLVPHGASRDIDPEKVAAQDIILRELPVGVEGFRTSVWIIDDLFVQFSGRYPFIVAVKHRIITESMRGIFRYLWSVSSPIDGKTGGTK